MRFIYAIIEVFCVFTDSTKWCLNASFQVIVDNLELLVINIVICGKPPVY